jgi:hypothetical protein
MEILTGEIGRSPSAAGQHDGSGRPCCSAPKSRQLVPLQHTYCTVRSTQARLTRDHRGVALLRGVSLWLRQSDATSHSQQKHGAVTIAPSRLNKSQSRSGASNGSRDRVPSGPTCYWFSGWSKTTRGSNGCPQGRDLLQAIQAHSPDRPAGRLEPLLASLTEGTNKA